MSRIIRFPGASTPPVPPDRDDTEEVRQVAPLDAEALHQLEVRVDVARERVLLWRIAVVFAALAGVLLARSLWLV